MEKKMLLELQMLLEEINPKEVAAHLMAGNLFLWLYLWKIKASTLVKSLLESEG